MRSILNGASLDQSDAEVKPSTTEADNGGQAQGSAPVLSSKFKSGGFKKAFVPIDTAAPESIPIAPGVAINLDEDLDGEAMELDDDIDGEAMGNADEEEDLDGEAMVD